MVEISREEYAALYGPTVGDQIRLGDTDLWIEVEKDYTAGGEEAVFGGGKSIRESMAQGSTTRAQGAVDTVITNAIVLDHWGIVRADVGIRDGRIVALGRSGNPDVADGVHPDLHIGPSTDVISGEGKILTAGGFDSHVHLLSPSQIHEALATGLTTIGGGGTGPSEGTKATTVTPGAWHLEKMHRSMDALPVNVLLLGKGNTVSMEGLAEQALAGAGGYKVHEDWGSTPGRHRRRPARCRRVGFAGRSAFGLAQRVGLRAVDHRRHRRSIAVGIPRRGGRRRPRPGHPQAGRPADGAARLDQPDAAAHGQHRGRAPGHADGLPSPEPSGAGGSRVRRVPDQGHHHRRRGRAARHGCDLADLVGRAGDGPDRRGHHPHLAGGPRDEAAPRRHRRFAARRQFPGQALHREIHHQSGDLARRRARDRQHRGRQAGRSGAVGTEVLRRASGHRHQGRRHRLGRPRRSRTPPSPRRSRC